MVVINSQPWGIGHWFVFKRVCVHYIGMKATCFSDSFLITYVCQLIPKLTNHINKKVNILIAPLITKIKQNLHQKIQEKLGVSQRIWQWTHLGNSIWEMAFLKSWKVQMISIYNCYIYMFSMKLKSSLLSFIWGVLQWFLKVFTIFFLRKTWFLPISSFRKLEKYKTLPPIFSHLNTRC